MRSLYKKSDFLSMIEKGASLVSGLIAQLPGLAANGGQPMILFVVGIASRFSLAAPALGEESIKFALPGNSMGYLPLFVAVHRGFFKDEGLDIELPRLIPAMAQNALLAGEVQYHGLADSGLRLAARGLPIKAIFYGADRPMYYLVAQKEIRSVAELRGKRIGVSQFGGTSDLSARLALKHFGVEPEKDALLIQIGAEGTRMDALITLASTALGLDFRAGGLTLEKMGLAKIRSDDLQDILVNGF